MERLAACLSTEYYREALAKEKDAAKRQLLEHLLTKAEVELAAALEREKNRH